MCGIAGLFSSTNFQDKTDIVEKMTDAMIHRGPDAGGFFSNEWVALGHRRLSIIDVSAAGNQPFTSNCGRYTCVFNGEIYNYQSLRAQLEPLYEFKSQSDTEVLLAAFIVWGEGCLVKMNGMFAFAIYDVNENCLFLARDRFGVKPLYYFYKEGTFLFSSEIRSMLASNLVARKINYDSLYDYLSTQSVKGPSTIIDQLQEIPAGTCLRVEKNHIKLFKYWNLTEEVKAIDHRPANEKAILKNISDLLFKSVESRMVSEVPISSFLSGGIDSSMLVGIMSKLSSAPIHTFNVSFQETEFDESYYAAIVAKKFNTIHTRVLVKKNDFLDQLIPSLDAMDSVTGDGVNSYVISKVIRDAGFKVALTGSGGDELFGGYPFFKSHHLLNRFRFLWDYSYPLRKIVGNLPFIDQNMRFKKVAQFLQAKDSSILSLYPLYREIQSDKTKSNLLKSNFLPKKTNGKGYDFRKSNNSRLPILSQVSIAEYEGYTQFTLLKDMDQMGMANSLEIREPFFDHELIQYVLSIPDKMKISSTPKHLLIKSMNGLIPDEVIHRKKMGFQFPWSVWMKSELKEFCAYHLKMLGQRHFINNKQLDYFWQKFLKGDPSIRWMELWILVVLEHWLEKNGVE